MRSIVGTHLTREKYVEHIKSDFSLMFHALAGPTVAVPSCPEWDTNDLARHMGMVYLHQAYVVENAQPPENEEHLESVADIDSEFELLDVGYAAIIKALDVGREERPTWSWHHSDFTTDFWFRRMAHETVIHRIDAQLSRGEVTAIDDDLAVDGVDEVLDFLPLLGSWDEAPNVDFGIVAVCAITSQGATYWTVEFTSERATVTRADGMHPQARLTISGDAQALDLYLWGRITSDDPRITLTGEGEVTFKKLMQVAVL